MKEVDLVLHPVRLRIILAFARGRRLTPQQVAAELSDVPQASLYRHIERLLRGGVLAIAAEKRVRGALERTYVLAETGALLSPKQSAKGSRDEYLRHFVAFAASLIAQFDQYLTRPGIDPQRDGVGYSEIVFNLTDQELREMASELRRALRPFVAYEPTPHRKRRVVATILMPIDDLA